MARWRARIVLLCGVTWAWCAGRPMGAATAPPGLPPLVQLLGQVDDPTIQRDVLRGMQEALTGRRQVPMPADWPAVYRKLAASPLPEVREEALALAVQFGDMQAMASVRKVVADASAPAGARQAALQTLLYTKDPHLVPLLQELMADRAMRGLALRGLAAYGNENTPSVILRYYPSLTEEEKSEAIQTLTSRPAYTLALLDAVESGQVPRRGLSAFTVRQMLALKDKAIAARLDKVWGTLRPASQEKQALMARYRALLTPGALKKADRSHGRLVFARTCAACHRLFDSGGTVGPELTGSQRANLDYVLENALDPSAIVPFDYQVTILETKDGRVLTGIIKQETERTLTVQTQTDRVIVPKDEVETRVRSPLSMMPEGLFAKLTNEEVRDLVAYLASPSQVPLPQQGPGHR